MEHDDRLFIDKYTTKDGFLFNYGADHVKAYNRGNVHEENNFIDNEEKEIFSPIALNLSPVYPANKISNLLKKAFSILVLDLSVINKWIPGPFK